MRCGTALSFLAIVLAAREAPARPPGRVDDRPEPPGSTKLGTRDGRKIEPLGDEAPPQMAAIRPGGTWLRPPGDRVSVTLGYERIGQLHYLMLWPQLDMTADGFFLSVGTPLRLEFFNPTIGAGIHGVRGQDWRGIGDVERLVNELRWRSDPFELRMTRFERTTIGEGQLVREHEPNLFVGSARLSTLATVSGARAAAQLYLDDLAAPHLLALHGEVRPFDAAGTAVRTLSLALTGVVDPTAPRTLRRFPGGVPHTSEDGEFEVGDDEAAGAFGVTLRSTVLDDGSRSLTPFLDASCLGGAGCGQTAGATLRLGATSHVDLRLELRRFDGDYLPGYFDAYYEASRFQLVGLRRGFRGPPKYAALSGRSGSHVGWATGVTWIVPGRFAAGLTVEDAAVPAARAFRLHAEVPVWKHAQAIATVERRNLSAGSDLLDLDATDTTGFVGVRIRTAPFLHVHLGWFRRFTVNRAIGEIEPEEGSTAELELGWDL